MPWVRRNTQTSEANYSLFNWICPGTKNDSEAVVKASSRAPVYENKSAKNHFNA